MRLIDADEAIVCLLFEWDDITPKKSEVVDFLRHFNEIDAEKWVGLIRCKDCEGYVVSQEKCKWGCLPACTPDGYCSYAIKKR